MLWLLNDVYIIDTTMSVVEQTPVIRALFLLTTATRWALVGASLVVGGCRVSESVLATGCWLPFPFEMAQCFKISVFKTLLLSRVLGAGCLCERQHAFRRQVPSPPRASECIKHNTGAAQSCRPRQDVSQSRYIYPDEVYSVETLTMVVTPLSCTA